MVYSFDGFNYVIRLDKGDKLVESLQKFVSDTKLEGAWVSGMGGALDMMLGFYNLEAKQYVWKTFNGLFEVVNLAGNIAYDPAGKPVFHLHGTFSDKDYKTMAGHVKDLTVAATLELFIHRTYKPLHRKLNSYIGLPTLDLQ